MTAPYFWALVRTDDGGTVDSYSTEAEAISGFKAEIADGCGRDELILLPYSRDGRVGTPITYDFVVSLELM